MHLTAMVDRRGRIIYRADLLVICRLPSFMVVNPEQVGIFHFGVRLQEVNRSKTAKGRATNFAIFRCDELIHSCSILKIWILRRKLIYVPSADSREVVNTLYCFYYLPTVRLSPEAVARSR